MADETQLAGTRFQDRSLLTGGSGWINLAARHGALTVKYEITGGTGRFTNASGNRTMTATLVATLRNASNAPAPLINTGEFEGTLINVNQFRSGWAEIYLRIKHRVQ